MTVGAFRDQSVPGMTCGAADLAVFTWGCRPLGVNSVMAGITGLQINRIRQGDIQRLVNIMALGTGRHGLCFKMRFMTFVAAWNIAVPIVVAAATFQLGMFARRRLQLLGLITVTTGAKACKPVGQGDTTWRMRIYMAGQTLHMLGAMWGSMAGSALRHDLRVIVLPRVIGMKNFMTFSAIELMLATGLFQVSKLPRMALPTLVDRQRQRISRIKRNILCRQVWARRLLSQGARKRPGQQKYDSNQNYQADLCQRVAFFRIAHFL